MLNKSLSEFKRQHQKKINQVLFVSRKINDDTEILNLIENFLVEKNSFIFESVEKGKIKGRYTIFGKNPDKIWEFNNDRSYLIEDKSKKRIKGSPDKIIEKIIESFNFKTPTSLPPICSLISGYFSYDSIRYIEKIPNKCKDDLKLPDVRLLRPQTVIIHDNLKKKIFYIVNVFKDKKISNYKKVYLRIKEDIERLLMESSFKKTSPQRTSFSNFKVKSNTSKNKFLAMITRAKKYIKLGDIFQVVLSQRFEAKLSKSPLDIYKKLRNTNPSPFMYFFNFTDFQIIGASPEILVRLRDNKITVRPIAGTRPRGKDVKEDNFLAKDLLNDKKELSEHLMLLDLGRNDAGKVSKINSIKVTESFIIEKYSHVMHIVSNVIGIYNKKYSKFKTLLAGFPAGTVSGAPKIRAMEIIDELETSKRKVYAGGIGYFSSNGEFDTCIALRTAIAKNDKFYVQAGAGIVADSNPIKEYEETINKAKALLSALR
ncbi:MAG: anthranilate synthase component I [Candidatus Pelagibacter bacterium]|nr:anthranilate synthase component I [Candidatus Pelagibacter bacterium]